MKRIRFLMTPLALVSTFLVACNYNSSKSSSLPSREKITVMAYNVENLFDTLDDADRDDITYLPLSVKQQMPDLAEQCKKMGSPGFIKDCMELDWSDSVLATKMTRLADTIFSVNGVGPDILLVEEVENQNVLDLLNQRYLAKARYQTSVVLEGEDERGIDVGILSRYPLAGKPVLHSIDFTPPEKQDPAKPWQRPTTRGILEVPLLLPTGETLYVFTFHFPSQSNPTQQRLDAVKMLNRLIQSKGPGALAIAGGDCNITTGEEAKFGYIKNILASEWAVSHLVGCKDCQGTEAYFEKDKNNPKGGKIVWSFFDLLLFSPALTNQSAGYVLAPETIRIPKSGKYQVKPDGTPSRFDVGGGGVSDHFPMYGELFRR